METVYFASIFVVRRQKDGHELLLGRRAEGDRYMAGTWQLISGRVEPNETAWQAALREIDEETGLVVQELYRLTSVTPFYRAEINSICIGIGFCALVDQKAEPRINPEHTHLEWVPIDCAHDRLMWASDRAALDEVRTQIVGNGPTKPYLRIELPYPV